MRSLPRSSSAADDTSKSDSNSAVENEVTIHAEPIMSNIAPLFGMCLPTTAPDNPREQPEQITLTIRKVERYENKDKIFGFFGSDNALYSADACKCDRIRIQLQQCGLCT